MDKIKSIDYNGVLFRANKNLYKNNKLYLASKAKRGNLASVNYKNAPTKYFTLKRSNVNAYTKNGETFTKNWSVIETLKLVDILDLKTRKVLEEKFKNDEKFVDAITQAFPIDGNTVRRISNSSEEDNQVLNKICELGYDGYYMNAEERRIGFHSEVGLCNKAFNKLKLMKNSERKYVHVIKKGKNGTKIMSRLNFLTKRNKGNNGNNGNNVEMYAPRGPLRLGF
jgi:hypothetical protein